MASSVMMDRTGMMTGMSGTGMPTTGGPATMPATTNWMMVPRCTYQFEKCAGGFKLTCRCDDKMACSMVQNLCQMLAGGMVSCCCTLNGMVVYSCCFPMGHCSWETTADGVCLTCTSGDSKCCEMLQAMCDCLCCLTQAGCSCCLMVNQTPVSCGVCGETTTKSKK